MGKFLKQYDKEHMKMAMLKHEETFRYQVHELHRLYQVQKILMNDMKAELKRQSVSSNSQRNTERWNAEDVAASHKPCNGYTQKTRLRQTLDLELPAEEYIGKEGGVGMPEVEEEGELELTLATGSRRKKKDETSFTSDSGASFSSSSTESKSWGLFQVNSFQSDRRSAFDVEEEQVRQDRMNQPPWLFQCLSLNMT